MHTNTTIPILDPVSLAQKTTSQIEEAVNEENESKGMLDALQAHYDTMYRNQKLYVDYLTELVDRLKEVQKGDKESFSTLKKEVIKHVLDSEKKRNSSQGV